MIERLSWMGGAAVTALLLVSIGWTSRAHASPGVLSGTPTAPFCSDAIGSDGCAGSATCPTGQSCRSFLGGTLLRCVDDNARFCCDVDADCPHPLSGGEATVCTVVTGLEGRGLCLPAREYCSDAPTLVQIAACHSTSSTGTAVVAWPEGDCDRDGVTNGEELRNGTDPCLRPPPPSIWDETQCVPIDVGCTLGAECTNNTGTAGTCEAFPDGNGTFCRPSEPVLVCCEGGASCGAEAACTSVGDSTHVCIPNLCARVAGLDPIACVTNEAGELVPFPEGDCDRDGETNANEANDRRDPCRAEQADGGVSEDAGGAEADAGATSEDAGAGFDGGESGVLPSFSGGGGCVCRAAPSAPGRGAVWLALAALALVIRRRR